MDQINDLDNLVLSANDNHWRSIVEIKGNSLCLADNAWHWSGAWKEAAIKHLEEMLLHLWGSTSENEDLAAENTHEIKNDDPK